MPIDLKKRLWREFIFPWPQIWQTIIIKIDCSSWLLLFQNNHDCILYWKHNISTVVKFHYDTNWICHVLYVSKCLLTFFILPHNLTSTKVAVLDLTTASVHTDPDILFNSLDIFILYIHLECQAVDIFACFLISMSLVDNFGFTFSGMFDYQIKLPLQFLVWLINQTTQSFLAIFDSQIKHWRVSSADLLDKPLNFIVFKLTDFELSTSLPFGESGPNRLPVMHTCFKSWLKSGLVYELPDYFIPHW